VFFYNAEPSFATPPETLDLIDGDDYDVDSCTGEACTFEMLDTFADHGLVVLNTHGLPNGVMTGFREPIDASTSPADIQAAVDAAGLAGPIRGERARLVARKRRKVVPGSRPVPPQTDANTIVAYATSKRVSEIPDLSSTVVLGNFCYSGQTSTDNLPGGEVAIGTAFQSRSPISYYGYSLDNGQSLTVGTDHCVARERAIVERLLVDGDVTGVAHLDPSGDEVRWTSDRRSLERFGYLWFRQVGDDDHCFDDCPPTFVDDRDEQVYPQVCIGEQVWMAANLAWATEGALTTTPDPTGERFGRFYPMETIMGEAPPSNAVPSGVRGVCPEGWHVPSDAEWSILEAEIGMPEAELDLFDVRGVEAGSGALLKAADEWASSNTAPGLDAYGLSVLPAGVVRSDLDISSTVGFRATFPTSSGDESSFVARNFRDLSKDVPGDGIARVSYLHWDVFHYTVRCVKDPAE